jgi:hypothetical protein
VRATLARIARHIDPFTGTGDHYGGLGIARAFDAMPSGLASMSGYVCPEAIQTELDELNVQANGIAYMVDVFAPNWTMTLHGEQPT